MGKTTGADRIAPSEVAEFSAANDPVLRAKVAGDVYHRLEVQADGSILTGDGTAAPAATADLSGAPRSAYTQTYATADKTLAAQTAAAVATTAATQTTPYGYATQAQADASITALNALRADHLDLAQTVNALIDDLQALGLVG